MRKAAAGWVRVRWGPPGGDPDVEWGAPAVAAVAVATVQKELYLKTWLRYCREPRLLET